MEKYKMDKQDDYGKVLSMGSSTQLAEGSLFNIYNKHQQWTRNSSGQQRERCQQELCPQELRVLIKMLPLLMQPYQQHAHSTTHSCPQQGKMKVRINTTYEGVPDKRALLWVGGWMNRWTEEQTDRQMAQEH